MASHKTEPPRSVNPHSWPSVSFYNRQIFDSGEAAGQLGAGSRSTIAVVDRDLGRPRFGVKAEPAELGWPESGTCRAARR